MKKSFIVKELLPLLLRLAALAALFIIIIANYSRLTNIDVRALVDAAPGEVAALLVVLGIFLVKGFVFVIPAMLIYVSVGMAFDAPVAVALSLCGIALEVSGTYLLGRALGGDYVERLISKAKGGQKLLSMKDKAKGWSLFTIRFLPVFPIDFASLFLGSVKYSFLPYLLISVGGIAPRVILFTLLGDKAYEIIPMEWILRLILIIIPAAAVAVVLRWVAKRFKTDK